MDSAAGVDGSSAGNRRLPWSSPSCLQDNIPSPFSTSVSCASKPGGLWMPTAYSGLEGPWVPVVPIAPCGPAGLGSAWGCVKPLSPCGPGGPTSPRQAGLAIITATATASRTGISPALNRNFLCIGFPLITGQLIRKVANQGDRGGRTIVRSYSLHGTFLHVPRLLGSLFRDCHHTASCKPMPAGPFQSRLTGWEDDGRAGAQPLGAAGECRCPAILSG